MVESGIVTGKINWRKDSIDPHTGKSEVIFMLTDYIRASMHRAKYEILGDDGTFYGEIPGFNGVYANADTLEKCREELEEVLEEWIFFRVSRNLPLPVVEGIELTIKEAV